MTAASPVFTIGPATLYRVPGTAPAGRPVRSRRRLYPSWYVGIVHRRRWRAESAAIFASWPQRWLTGETASITTIAKPYGAGSVGGTR